MYVAMKKKGGGCKKNFVEIGVDEVYYCVRELVSGPLRTV